MEAPARIFALVFLWWPSLGARPRQGFRSGVVPRQHRGAKMLSDANHRLCVARLASMIRHPWDLHDGLHRIEWFLRALQGVSGGGSLGRPTGQPWNVQYCVVLSREERCNDKIRVR